MTDRRFRGYTLWLGSVFVVTGIVNRFYHFNFDALALGIGLMLCCLWMNKGGRQ